MSEVNAAGSLYASDVELADTQGTGLVQVGGVAITADEAAELVMMHKSQVMKEVCATRTELAQRHLDRIKIARQYKNVLKDLKAFVDTDKSWKDRIPVTPALISFMKNEVGVSPGESVNRIIFWGSAVKKLPKSVCDHYGLLFDLQGNWQPYASGKYGIEPNDDGTNRWEMHGITIVDKEARDNMEEELNNYIDQQNDGNNLMMSQLKSLVNSLTESVDTANSLGDKKHEFWRTALSSF